MSDMVPCMLLVVTLKALNCGNAGEVPHTAGKVPERRLRPATVAPNCSSPRAGKAPLLAQAAGRVPDKGVSCKNNTVRDGKAAGLPHSGGTEARQMVSGSKALMH